MPKKPQNLSLASLGRLMDQKLLPIHRQLANLLGETVFTRNEVNSLRSEMNTKFEEVNLRFEKVNSEIGGLRSEVKQGFNEVDDKLQNLLHEAATITDQKLETFRQKYLAT